MAEVNIKELREAAEKKQDAQMNVSVINIGGKDYFKGKVIDSVFETYDECLNANQRSAMLAKLKAEGKDEFGRTPEQIRIAKEIADLMKKKNRLLEQARDIDIEISEVRSGKKEEVKATPRKSKK